jgi:hypothetical protein
MCEIDNNGSWIYYSSLYRLAHNPCEGAMDLFSWISSSYKTYDCSSSKFETVSPYVLSWKSESNLAKMASPAIQLNFTTTSPLIPPLTNLMIWKESEADFSI